MWADARRSKCTEVAVPRSKGELMECLEIPVGHDEAVKYWPFAAQDDTDNYVFVA